MQENELLVMHSGCWPFAAGTHLLKQLQTAAMHAIPLRCRQGVQPLQPLQPLNFTPA